MPSLSTVVRTTTITRFARQAKGARPQSWADAYLALAETQIEDWRIWINCAEQHFARELVALAKGLPEWPFYSEGDRGFRLCSAEALESYWRGFGGERCPVFTFTIVIGRWSQLKADEKARLLNRNRSARTHRIHSYEQLARNANFRLERDDWHNSLDDWDVISVPITRSGEPE